MAVKFSVVLSQTLLFLVINLSGISKAQHHRYPGYYTNRGRVSQTSSPPNIKDTVSIKVYYETQCPGSIQFLKEQLGPTVERLGAHLDIYMIPYGHAKTYFANGRYTFECQHGDVECYGNMLHATAIDVIRNNTKAALFNACVMERTTDYNTLNYLVNSCSYKYDVPVNAIWENMNNGRGALLLKAYGDETHTIRPRYVPYVVLDGTEAESIVTNHLGYFICKMLYPRPQIDSIFENIEKKDNQAVKGDKVDLKLYYESFCGDCVNFYAGPLFKAYKKLGPDYIDLSTYPYGNAHREEEDGKTMITCQHGPIECYGNKLHACAIDILKDTTQYVPYINCMMTHESTDSGATNCGDSMGVDAKAIIACAKSEKGDQLLEYYGKETEKISDLYCVPWVLLNGKRFEELDNLMNAICEALNNPPPACKEYL